MKRTIPRFFLRIAGAVLLATVFVATLLVEPAFAASSGTIDGRLVSRTDASDVIKLERLPDAAVFQLPVAAADIRLIKDVPLDTVIRIEVDDTIRPAQITRVDKISVPIGIYPRLVAIGGSFVILFGLAMLATRGKPLRFLIGLDNRYSNSQSQLVLWFGALAVIYCSAVILRIVYLKGSFIGGVGVTANVIALTGLSAVSFWRR